MMRCASSMISGCAGRGQGFPRLRFSHADRIASRARARTEDGRLVTDQASGLAAAPVNAQVNGHERSSTIKSIFTTEARSH
jgi:hypothetical protein